MSSLGKALVAWKPGDRFSSPSCSLSQNIPPSHPIQVRERRSRMTAVSRPSASPSGRSIVIRSKPSLDGRHRSPRTHREWWLLVCYAAWPIMAYYLVALYCAVTLRSEENRQLPWRLLMGRLRTVLLAASGMDIDGLRVRGRKAVSMV